MEDPIRQDSHTDLLLSKHQNLPPTPPYTEENISDSCDHDVEIPLPPPTVVPIETLDIDSKTPDAHVPRDPRLIRLTGVHPFNVEAPLSALFDEGFLTSPELFYVRNHGAVPEVKDDEIPDWEFSVEGQLIAEYEQITCPVTLVCAGNRRKEQNQVRKSKGFSWGAAGVSTALFTGVALGEVLKRAQPIRRARYPNGYYGTSVKLNWALDANRGMMLAHKMNGEMLRPDHGKPLRVVIPGQIGGRSVKWLKKLVVTAAPSDNWYHIYDNRVLPTMIGPEQSANEPNTWADERYAIFDLNVNSAIAYPAHDERLMLANAKQNYTVQGYAYSGGGRRVTRVELSLDKGRTWRLANVNYPEDLYRETDQYMFGGRIDMSWRESCFCWCQWSFDVPVSELMNARDIVVRAMDDAMNVQPKDMYWSVLGMMNNPWFRVVVHNDGEMLIFEHPTQPALQPGGWMEEVKKAGGNLSNGHWGEKIGNQDDTPSVSTAANDICMTKEGLKQEISLKELQHHESEADPWFVLNGEVYSGTSFLNDHPGGAQSILSAAAQDTTDEFMAIHSETAKAMMPTYHVGTLSSSALTNITNGSTDSSSSGSSKPALTFLNSRQWSGAPLIAKRIVSSDTVILTFALQHEKQTLGLPTGQHLMIRVRDAQTQESIIRSYTPISETARKGDMEILVKLYLATAANRGGKMSKALHSLSLNSIVEFKGPTGKFEYLGNGRCAIGGKERKMSRFCMIAAGSGITPIFQVFRAMMRERGDETRCTVLNGNRNEEDILCRAELEGLLQGQKGKGEVLHTLTNPPWGWKGRRGRIDKGLIGEKFGTADGETLVLICGPPGLEKAVHEALRGLGWADEQILFF
ncbi:uncharacterized protein KY384_008691 [Bacidia gigantensis]|uniref:uncharacterized protein n=1 Tax=Bacidia gigantensis TaxID=2732470 RepID=UPI001D037D23|nr:uncharacterized protein KY384_008691 [Bacidia gigantensis]KAG8526491.1 hypothetical protein KY384_008691 [Bacidia gigantensis]